MNTPQDRVIKKMIDNIVESNKPVFEKPATGGSSEAPRVSSSSPTSSQTSTGATAEDSNLVMRKLDYGFNSLRSENAELRKQLEDLSGAVRMLRNDLDTVRQAVLRGHNPQASPAREAPTQPMTSASGGSLGAPQYRKTEADEAYEQEEGKKSGGSSEAQQPRGFQKKNDAQAQVDIAKVFYYGKK